MYADDCIHYCTGNTWERVYMELQQSLAIISIWLERNGLRLNVDENSIVGNASVLLVEIGPDRVQVPLKASKKNRTLGRLPAQKVHQ